MHKTKKFLSACMMLVMALGLFSPAALAEGPADGNTAANIVTQRDERAADTATYKQEEYEDVLGEDKTTRYDGRVWTDKTVTEGDITFSSTHGNSNSTVEIGDSDFLVTYSALSTATSVEQTTPVDVVFVLDFSASMNWAVDAEQVTAPDDDTAKAASRLNAMVSALNKAVDTLVENNEQNRVGVAVFNGTSTEMMGLTTAKDIKDKVSDGEYFTISSFALKSKEDDADKQEADATVTCNINGKSVNTAGGTNIQAGLWTGIQLLQNAADTKVTLADGETPAIRVPNLILMSDGAPTTFTSANDATYYDEDGKRQVGSIDKDKSKLDDPKDHDVQSGSWWENLTGKQIGAGNNNEPDSADGFMALLTAAYGKEQITEHYYGKDPGKNSAKMYSIGFSTKYQTTEMVQMANLVLNPAENLDDGSVCDEVKEVSTAWQSYQNGNKAVVHAPLGSGSNSNKYPYVVAQAPGGAPASLVYTDGYYPAEDGTALDNAFNDIIQKIVTGAKMPTEVTGSATSSGYLTYTDTLGKYMEVDDVKAILWNGTLFAKDKTSVTDGNVTTYTFHGEIKNPAYTQDNDVSNILITVTDDPDNHTQTVQIKIPAAAIPLRVNTVKNIGMDSYELTSNYALPVRIVYGVSVSDSVLTADGKLNTEAVDADYLQANRDGQSVKFYSNLYTGEKGEGTTIGNATVTFTPAKDNPFYYMQQNTQLYKDKTLGQPVTESDLQSGALPSDGTYYFEISYYDETGPQSEVIARAGFDFEADYLKTDDNGRVYIRQGAPRLGNLNQFVKDKDNPNTTQTAQTYYYPYYIGGDDATGASLLAAPASGDSFGIALGNNGVVSVSPATGSLEISKTVTAADASLTIPDQTFTFQVELKDAAGKPLSGVYDYTQGGSTEPAGSIANNGEIQLKADESVKIVGLPLNTQYTVTETYLPAGFTQVTATGASGTLVESQPDATAAFTNRYSVTPAYLDLTVTKTLTDVTTGQPKEMTEGQFSFSVFKMENGVESSKPEAVATNKADGSVTLSGISFAKAGDYQLVVRENDSGAAGYTYDDSYYLVDVAVSDNGQGALEAQVRKYTKVTADGSQSDASDIQFENTYRPTEATVELTLQKTLTQDGTAQPMNEGQFQFLLKPNSVVAGDPVQDPGLTKYNMADGSAVYTLHYTRTGVYTYTLTENKGNDDKIVYDETSYQVTVEVTDVNGALQAVTTVKNGETTVPKEEIPFHNYVVSPAKLTLQGDKKLVWGEQAAEQATDRALNLATLSDVQATDETAATMESAAPANVALFAAGDEVNNGESYTFSYTVVDPQYPDEPIATVSSGANEAFSIPLSFDKAGTYTYQIQENRAGENDGGIQYSDARYTLNVEVKDAGQGKLEVDDWNLTDENNQPVSAVSFTNTYTTEGLPKNVSLDLNARKVLEGDRPLQDNEFTFKIEELVNDESVGVVSTGKNDANGNITFDTIQYTQDDVGTHTYRVYEEKGKPYQGIQYSDASYTFTVEVKDQGDGTLAATVTKGLEDFVFTNTYQKPTGASVTLEGTKVLENKELTQGMFHFTLTDENGEKIMVSNGTAGADGTVDPGKFSFRWNITPEEMNGQAEKTFTYTVTEETGNDPRVEYSDQKYVVKVTVKADERGNLTAGAPQVFLEDGTTPAELQFTNVYKPENVSLSLSGGKTLHGRDLQAEEFSFAVAENNVIKTVGKNDADGQITFEPISYSMEDVGTHTYTVYEVKGSDTHIDYDDTQYTVQVQVTNQNGKLQVSKPEIKLNGQAVEQLAFENTYTPDPVEITLQATKQLNGRDLQAEEFSFYVKDDQGKTLATAKNAADGSITFTGIRFTEPGTYLLTVGEDKGNAESVTYDETVYHVTVTVTDKDGALQADIQQPEALVFTNTYEPPEVTPTPTPDQTPKPEVTPTPTPDQTPKPEVTPSPKPDQPSQKEKDPDEDTNSTANTTPTPTPAATAAPTPAPTATPTPVVIPQTGDESHPALWLVLLAVSAGAAAALWVYKRKQQ